MDNSEVTILHGSALDVLQQLDSDSVDALISDPPYSSGGMHAADRVQPTSHKYSSVKLNNRSEDFLGDNKDQRSWTLWMTAWLAEALRVVRPGGPVVLFTDWRQLPATTDALQWAGWVWRGVVPWDKRQGRPVKGRFRAQAEYAAWGSKGPMPLERGVPALPGAWSVSAPSYQRRRHQTEKPLALMRELVRICPEGGVVLDPFMGSGTTGEAARLEGRRFIGVELSGHYVEVARGRLVSTAMNQGGLARA